MGKKFSKAILPIALSFFLSFSSSAQNTDSPSSETLSTLLDNENLRKYLEEAANKATNKETSRFLLQPHAKDPEYEGALSIFLTKADNARDVNTSLETVKRILGNAMKDGSVSGVAIEDAAYKATIFMHALKQAYENFKGTENEAAYKYLYEKSLDWADVIHVDNTKRTGFDDSSLREVLQLQVTDHMRRPDQSGVETGPFFYGFIYSAMDLAVALPVDNPSDDPVKQFEQAKQRLASLQKDELVTFFKGTQLETKMSINQALALMERATDGVDDPDISQKDAAIAGLLVGFHYQQEGGICYDGVMPEKLR